MTPWRGVTPNADCAYTIGRKFLSVMYVELGREVVAAWLRGLYLAGQNKIDPETSSDVRLTEAEIYHVLLSNTPASKRGEVPQPLPGTPRRTLYLNHEGRTGFNDLRQRNFY